MAKTLIEKAQELRGLMDMLGDKISDKEALEMPLLIAAWNGDSINYVQNDRRRYNDVVYKCLLSHPSQADWNPEDSPSLWTRVEEIAN